MSRPPVDPERLARARAAAQERGVDALLVTPSADLRYLTGYAPPPLERLTCLVLPADGPAFLVVPTLERPAAEASPVPGLDVEIVDWAETVDPHALVAARLGRPRRVAVADQMWAAHVLAFRRALPATELTLAGPLLHALRRRKTADEVAALRRAAAAIDRVHARMGEWLRPGRTERAVARDVAEAILAEGHSRVDFVIVAGGSNAASPHHEVSDRVLAAGDPVVVDIGGTTAEGYCSDATRTYALGAAPAEFCDYYAVLQEAQQRACAAVAPGVPAGEVDAAAREVISAAGYGPYFMHRTGHGIGLETHEEPYLVAGNALPLEPGMAFSVEPGIYLPGRHGARIEDIVVCTADGVERLNTRPRALAVLD